MPGAPAPHMPPKQSKNDSLELILTMAYQETGAQGRIRTSVARKERQIYSLLPLTTRPPVRTIAERRAHRPAICRYCFLMGHRPVPTRLRSWRRELNPRPADYKSAALPTELRQR